MNRDYEVERALKTLLKFADPDGLRCECPRYCRSCESQSAARSIRAALQATPQEVEMPSFGNLPTETVKLGEPLEAPTGEAKEIEIEHFGGSFNVHGVKDWGEGTYYFREVRGQAGAAPRDGGADHG